MRPPKGTPTDLNLSVLADVFADGPEAANQIAPTDAPHLRRCIKAGLVTVAGRTLRLTDSGRDALYRQAKGR